jgi:hypothetical protein
VPEALSALLPEPLELPAGGADVVALLLVHLVDPTQVCDPFVERQATPEAWLVLFRFASGALHHRMARHGRIRADWTALGRRGCHHDRPASRLKIRRW